MKRLWMILLAPLLMMSGVVATVPATAADSTAQVSQPGFTPPSDTPSVFGVNYHPMWSSMTSSTRAQILQNLADAGTQWVRIDVAWGTLQPTNSSTYDAYGVNQVDTRIKEIRAHGMKVLLMFYWAPAWSSGTTDKSGRPGNPTDYANAAAWVAKRYDGTTSQDLKIDAIELWNEPDLAAFWNPSPESTKISDFATLIKTAGPAVKKANPGLTVVVGGTASVNTDWYQTFYQTPGIVGTYDALGVHPYQSPGDAAPSAYDPKYGQYYMKHIPVLSDLMTSRNDPAAIWATEFGWSSHSNTSTTPNWQKGVTLDQQAQYLIAGTELMASYSRVEAAFWYNVRNTNEGDVHFDSYGLTMLDNTPKPAYHAFSCVASGVCGDPGATPPATPTGLTAKATGATTIELAWNPTPTATGYTVLRNGTPVGSVSTTSFSDNALQPATQYTYQVAAVNEAGTGPASESVSATTQSLSVAPAAPTGLTTTAVGSTSVTLAWSASPGATSYIVLRNGKQVAVTTKTTYQDSRLRRRTTYTYTVKAVGPGGTSAPSAALTVRTGSWTTTTNATTQTTASVARGTLTGMAQPLRRR